jgi:hypothetical protein
MKGAHKRKFKSERQASAARRAQLGKVWHEECGWLEERTYQRITQRDQEWEEARRAMLQ